MCIIGMSDKRYPRNNFLRDIFIDSKHRCLKGRAVVLHAEGPRFNSWHILVNDLGKKSAGEINRDPGKLLPAKSNKT